MKSLKILSELLLLHAQNIKNLLFTLIKLSLSTRDV